MDDIQHHMVLLYVFAETIRSNFEYFAFSSNTDLAPPLALIFSESLKLAVAAIYIFHRNSDGVSKSWNSVINRGIKEIVRYAIPAALDVVCSLFYLTALGFTSTNLLRVFVLAKLPLTAFLHHFWIRRQRNIFAWSSLIWICIGVTIFKWPPVVEEGFNYEGWSIAPLAGLAIACLSAISNISSETLTQSGAFWESQFWQYAWGFFFAIASYPITTIITVWTKHGERTKGTSPDFEVNYAWAAVYILATATLGINTGVILRKRDNLTKLVAMTTSLITSGVTLDYISTTLATLNTAWWTNFGALIATIAVGCYNYYKRRNTEGYAILDTNEWSESLELRKASVDTELAKEAAKIYLPYTENPSTQETSLKEEEYLLENPDKLSFSAIFHAATFNIFPKQVPTGSGLKAVLFFFVPSFIPTTGNASTKTYKEPHPTAWLDGVRGVAALCVVFHHSLLGTHGYLFDGWKGPSDSILKLPWIRFFISGHPQVAIFFVVSGFSLSYGLMKRIHAKDFSGFNSSLASSVIRRPFRLFLPCLFNTFLIMLIVNSDIDEGHFGVGRWPLFPNQFMHWVYDFVAFTDPVHPINLMDWTRIGAIYNGVTWTIPVEFRGSMVVYVSILACSRLRPKVRLAIFGFMAFSLGYRTYWDLCLFLSGSILAELHLMRDTKLLSMERIPLSSLEADIPSSSSAGEPRSRLYYLAKFKSISLAKIARNIFWIAQFMFAIYIMSMQGKTRFEWGQGDPGYVWLWYLTPKQYTFDPHWYRFWPGVGAVYLIWILDRCRFLQRLYTNSLARYLGRISFSIYLIHPVLLAIMGNKMEKWGWSVTGTDNRNWEYTMGFWLGYLPTFLVIVWVSDLWTKGIDENCVKFTKYGYSKLMALAGDA
jgi:UDP-sugar transporter A1/2/3